MEGALSNERKLHLLFAGQCLSLLLHIEEHSSPNLPLKIVIFVEEMNWLEL